MKSLHEHMKHVRSAVEAHGHGDHRARFVTLSNGIADRMIELAKDTTIPEAALRAQLIAEATENKDVLIEVAADAIFGNK